MGFRDLFNKDKYLDGKHAKILLRKRRGDGANVFFENYIVSEAGSVSELSDGYHTFDELYNHRNTLFISLLNQNKSISFKTLLDHNKLPCWDYFIGGIITPLGQASYHLPIALWDSLKVNEVDHYNAYVPYDGHNSNDVLKRIASL